MATYFFEIDDGTKAGADLVRDLANLELVRAAAAEIAADHISSQDMLRQGGSLVITVRDWPGLIVATLRLACQIEMPQ